MLHRMRSNFGRATAIGLLLLTAACNHGLDTVAPVAVIEPAPQPEIKKAPVVKIVKKPVAKAKPKIAEPVVVVKPEPPEEPKPVEVVELLDQVIVDHAVR